MILDPAIVVLPSFDILQQISKNMLATALKSRNTLYRSGHVILNYGGMCSFYIKHGKAWNMENYQKVLAFKYIGII